MADKLFKINDKDNVAIALEPLKKGCSVQGVTLLDDIPFGHKVLLEDTAAGENIIKYSNPIGHLIENTKKGSHIHCHNLKTNLGESEEYSFYGNKEYEPKESGLTFDGYVRQNGEVGIRNEIWIISTVGCVNNTVRMLEQIGREKYSRETDGVFAFTHPYGCSQMGDDQENTRRIIASLAKHPNAGGVLFVSLGCENTNINVLKDYLGEFDEDRIKFLVTQDCNDELEEGDMLLSELYGYVRGFKRTPVPLSRLTVGFKCGGSDALSGITANALCGRLTDRLTSFGASAMLTEVPEMFGAERMLMKRAVNEDVFKKIVAMINGYKEYFKSHNQVCSENPSPGNHDGGITTLEEKSLGCVQKGGNSVITDVLGYGEKCIKNGLNLLTGPGNDIVSVTNLTASGAHIILFTTGRGTPLGAPVPTIKISSNTEFFNKKQNWIDFDAGVIMNGADIKKLSDSLLDLIVKTASGKKTKNEINGYREISIFKDGVIM